MDKYFTNTSLGYSSLESGFFDSHRCGTAPFAPQIMPDGTQNSCASYASGFDENGCNKYLPNYPDDDYIQKYISSGGDCDDLKDCKREITPITRGNCNNATNEIASFGCTGTTIEKFGMFGMFPETPFGIVLLIVFLYFISKIIFK